MAPSPAKRAVPVSSFRLAVFPGDGIGPEVVAEAAKVLHAIEAASDLRFELTYDEVGGAGIDRYGKALRPEAMALARRSDAVLFGSVGGPKWDDPRAKARPEDAILGLRAGLSTYVNLRPARIHAALVYLSPLKPEIVANADVLFVRELVAGTYFAKPKRMWTDGKGTLRAVDTTAYTEEQVERTVRLAFELAGARRKILHMADKANVMATSRLWREVAGRVAPEFPAVSYQPILTDALAMHLLYRPTQFDVIVTDNLFGDILTDEAAALAGSMGLMPSASFGSTRNRLGGYRGLFEPIHGSAPDIAGQGKANPIAAILSLGLLFRYALKLDDAAGAVEAAVESAITAGFRTADIARSQDSVVTTSRMGDEIANRVAAANANVASARATG